MQRSKSRGIKKIIKKKKRGKNGMGVVADDRNGKELQGKRRKKCQNKKKKTKVII